MCCSAVSIELDSLPFLNTCVILTHMKVTVYYTFPSLFPRGLWIIYFILFCKPKTATSSKGIRVIQVVVVRPTKMFVPDGNASTQVIFYKLRSTLFALILDLLPLVETILHKKLKKKIYMGKKDTI